MNEEVLDYIWNQHPNDALVKLLVEQERDQARRRKEHAEQQRRMADWVFSTGFKSACYGILALVAYLIGYTMLNAIAYMIVAHSVGGISPYSGAYYYASPLPDASKWVGIATFTFVAWTERKKQLANRASHATLPDQVAHVPASG